MKRILLISTIYRVGERIYPIIPKLSEEFEVDVLKTSQMGDKITWYGNGDLREVFDNLYGEYVKNIFHKKPSLYNYDLIIMDDDRPRYGMSDIYNQAKQLGIPVIGHQHGNQEIVNILPNLREKGRVSWDYITVFGQKERDLYSPHIDCNLVLNGGIPCNDKLKDYKKTNENILVIVNFLGNRNAPFNKFDKEVFDKLCLLDLQKQYNKNIVIKIKSRADNPQGKTEDFKYLNDILHKDLKYDIVMDIDDDNKLISDSFFVISAPSVMALKPIQMGIPTVVLANTLKPIPKVGISLNNQYGQIGTFFDWDVQPLEVESIVENIENQFNKGRDFEWIERTIEGGVEYNSTEKYIQHIRNII